MTPSKGFLCFGLAIFISLIFQNSAFPNSNIPSPQSFSETKDITVQGNPALKEDQGNLSKGFNGTPLKAEQPPHPLSSSPEILNTDSGLETKTATSDDGNKVADEEYDVPITVNRAVEKNLDFFKYSLKDRFNMWLNRSGKYLSLMREIFQEKGLPQDLVFLALIESGFNPYAYSWAKAAGPWQFISSTAKRYGLKVNWWVDERRDPVKSTIAAAEYLKDLYEFFGSWNLAMAAYNAGERKVLNGLRKINGGDFWDLRDTKYLKRETKEYVPRYMAATIIAKNPEEHGFVVDYHQPLEYDEVDIKSPIDLKVVADCAETTFDVIKELNPELKRRSTPPDIKTYTIKIPEGTKEIFLANLDNVPVSDRFTGRVYTAKKGDTLNKIAKNFGVSKKTVMEVNSLGKRYKVRPGDTLLIPSGKNKVTVAKVEKKIEKKINRKKDTSQQKKIVYRVKKGDSLYKIAERHNITPDKIKEWNGLKNNKLKPGDKLYIFTSLDSPTYF